jgi:hypothetical protein
MMVSVDDVRDKLDLAEVVEHRDALGSNLFRDPSQHGRVSDRLVTQFSQLQSQVPGYGLSSRAVEQHAICDENSQASQMSSSRAVSKSLRLVIPKRGLSREESAVPLRTQAFLAR